MHKVLADQQKVVKDINLPFLKGWATYQSKEDPKRFIEVWTMDKDAVTQELDDAFMPHGIFKLGKISYYESKKL